MNSTPHASTVVAGAPAHYNRTAVGLHWLIAGLIGVALVMGWVMTDMAVTPLRLKLFNWHKWVGITVLWLAALRILWRVTHRPFAGVLERLARCCFASQDFSRIQGLMQPAPDCGGNHQETSLAMAERGLVPRSATAD